MSVYNDLAIEAFLESEFGKIGGREGEAILDLGCGKQPYRKLYASRFETAVAADFDVRSPIHVRLDACRLPFRATCFDVVLFSEVVEHVSQSDIVFREIARVLKPHGVLLLTWPFIQPMHELPHDNVRYTEFGMKQLIDGAGLRIETLARRGDVLCVLFAVVEEFVLDAWELLSRIPLVGRVVFGPIKKFFRALIVLIWHVQMRLTKSSKRLRPAIIGANLKGPVNHFACWTLGYCARVRKAGG